MNRYAQHATLENGLLTITVHGRWFQFEIDALREFADDFYEGEGCYIAIKKERV
jgi:hypothetical protein